jgi:hypothetical protein
MYYDKQARALVVPASEIARVERDGAEIDFTNGWVLNLPGTITITAKEETNEQDPGPRTSGRAED